MRKAKLMLEILLLFFSFTNNDLEMHQLVLFVSL